jgi:uncharacterized membrane protein
MTTQRSRAFAAGSAEQTSRLTPVLERNIEALHARRRRDAAAAPWPERTANAITRFAGSMTFVCLHLALFATWIVVNLGWIPAVHPWDKSFGILAMLASVEALFLSTFVLIAQNRMAAAADQRADLDLQISLLTEHEITQLVKLVSEMARHAGIRTPAHQELEDVKQDVAPDTVLDKIEKKAAAADD